LHKAIQRAHRDETGLAVLFIDLDRFKNINDTLGHQVGDRVLCEVARRLDKLMRESDTVGRLGGDEFLIVIEDIAAATAVSHIAEKILMSWRMHLSPSDRSFSSAPASASVFILRMAVTPRR
jgi:diguanylate cyclase (GGDEF)-like protein